MPIRSFRELIRRPPKRSAYVADTSFILETLAPGEARELKERLLESGSVLVYNVIVRNEVIRHAALLLMDRKFKAEPKLFTDEAVGFWNSLPEKMRHQKLKQLVTAGYIDLFPAIFGSAGELLNEEVDKILAGFTYWPKEKFNAIVSWENMKALMAMYGLDVSDAMILNLAASDRTLSGIISRDYDYLYCGEDLELILPRDRPLPKLKKCFRDNSLSK